MRPLDDPTAAAYLAALTDRAREILGIRGDPLPRPEVEELAIRVRAAIRAPPASVS
jgi:hypothetical protein